nr:porin [Shimia aestuarii]
MRNAPFLIAAIATLTSPMAQASEFGLPESAFGNGWRFAPYGRFNLAYQSFDDGQTTTANIVDMSTSTSRVGFYLKQNGASQGLSFQFETGLALSPSKSFSQINTPDFFGWDKTALRQVQLIYEADWGKLRLGQGSMATDSIAELDLAKTTVVAKSNIDEMGGSYIFRTTGVALSTVTLRDSFDSFDGDRQFRLRYDTPDLNGFSLAMAYGIEVLKDGVDDTYYDIALRYKQDFGALRVQAGIGNNYVDVSGGGTKYTTAGSLAVLDTNTGLNLTVASGRDGRGTNASYVWVKGGWNASFSQLGTTRFYAETHQGSDYVTKGAESRMWGLGVMQRIERVNLDLFAGYRRFSYSDGTPTTYRDADIVQIGAHITF